MKSYYVVILPIVVVLLLGLGIGWAKSTTENQDKSTKVEVLYYDKATFLEVMVIEDPKRGKLIYITRDFSGKFNTSSSVVNK